jgi:hypothetical protein
MTMFGGSEENMCSHALWSTAVALALTAGLAPRPGDADGGADAARVSRLVRQLGDNEFRKREEASKELEAIGEPALGALRKAESDDNPEVRRRAGRLVQTIVARGRAAAARKELARLSGSWEAAGGVKMTIRGDRFTSSTLATGPRNGKLAPVEVRDGTTLVDFVVEEGDVKGQTGKAILRLEGDTLHYCITYGEVRPAAFQDAFGNFYIPFKRAQK